MKKNSWRRPEVQPNDDVIDIFDIYEEVSDDDNEDYDAEQYRELPMIFGKPVKNIIWNEFLII